MCKQYLRALALIFAAALSILAAGTCPAQMLIVDVTDPELDLETQIQAHRADVTPLVEPGPKLVVGQGEDANSYTLIKCLSEYGVPYLQFLAYPTAVGGGVSVNTGDLLPDSGLEIVANPITSTVAQTIRVFTNTGLLKSEFQPASMTAPYVVAVSDFLSSHSGDEIAVTQRSPSGSDRIRFYDAYGTLLADWAAPVSNPAFGEVVTLAPLRMNGEDELLIGYPNTGWVYRMQAATGAVQAYDNSAIGPFDYLGESVAYDEVYSVGKSFPNTESTLWARTPTAVTAVNAGTKEKNFYIRPNSGDTVWADAAYVKNALFRHLRTDQRTPGYYNPDFENNDYDYWAGGSFITWTTNIQANYLTAKPSVWEPCFTHRHGASASTAWYNPIDPATGFRKYMMLSRLNNPVTYSETGTFNCLTYALDIAPINNMYVWPLREFLLRLADKFRGASGAPEQLVALEPNHEMEVPGTRDNSIGDYNTNMISGFYGDLIRRYNNLGKINTKFGTSFTQASFDAPRDLGRGDWDAYSESNAFFNAWVEYNRKVVLTRIAQGEREALMAGFPPAAIKTHQIPANYAVESVVSGHRITPIDWTLAGPCGYGGTRYGVWYQSGDFVAGALNSGFNMINIGEYNPLTLDQNAANGQMDYLFYNGVNFVSFEPGTTAMNLVAEAAYKRLFDYGPRPGTTDGIGQIRAVSQPTAGGGSKRYNVVCMGKTGLLKSLNANGSWEGTVYAEPFRQRVNITAISESISFDLTTSDYAIGPINGLMSGDQVEINFKARSVSANPAFTLRLEHDGVEMSGHRFVVGVTSDDEYYRYTLRIQEPMDSLRILISSGEKDGPTGYQQTVILSDFSVWVQKPAVTRVEYGIGNAKANLGGVTFDVLSASHIPSSTFDTTPKSITINSDWPYADSTSVTLNLSAAGAVEMRLRNAGATWGSWQTYTTSKPWTLTSGDGSKSVEVQFRDGAGTVSATFSDSIILDIIAPTASLKINSGAGSTNSTFVTLTSLATDAGSCVFHMRFLNAGDSTWGEWEPYAPTKLWTLRTGEGTQSVNAQFRDGAGNVSSSSSSILLDTIGPSGSITINSGDNYTSSTAVTLTLSADDQGSGVSKMRFSNDGSTWSNWVTLAATRSWTLTSGDGMKHVSAQFNDVAGNISTFADSILLDTTGPTGSIIINSGDESTNSTSVTLTLSATDEGSGVTEMALRNSGSAFGAWEPYATNKSWTLTSGDGTKTVYVLFRDAVGKISASYSDSIILNTAPPTVTSITPASGPNTGTTDIVDLAGTGFASGATAALQRLGQSGIYAVNTSVVSATKITCSFDLTGKAVGLWDVVVTNPGDLSGTLTGGFGVTLADTVPAVGTTIASLVHPISAVASTNYRFRVWGAVETIDAQSFWLDDGSGNRIRVLAQGYTGLVTGDFASATGTVDLSQTPPLLLSTPADVQEF